MAKMSDWKHLGTLACIQNVTGETTVDATFRKIEAFNTKLGENGLSLDLVANTITIAADGTYQFIGTTKFLGSVKTFEFQLFKNGIASGIIASDRTSGDAAVSGFVDLVAGDVLDARQRSSDGGTSLTIETMTVALERMY
jgi:hypothetical protein